MGSMKLDKVKKEDLKNLLKEAKRLLNIADDLTNKMGSKKAEKWSEDYYKFCDKIEKITK